MEVFFKKAALFLAAAVFLQLGTTYVAKEGDKEVGRWVEPDGKREVVEIQNDPALPAARKTAAPSPAGYSWVYDRNGYQKAAAEQAVTGKPVLLYFHATWCPYCKKLEREVFSNARVQDYLKDVIKVKIDAEKEAQLSERYQVNAYPRLFMADLKTGKNKRLHTSVTPQEFIRQSEQEGLKRPF